MNDNMHLDILLNVPQETIHGCLKTKYLVIHLAIKITIPLRSFILAVISIAETLIKTIQEKPSHLFPNKNIANGSLQKKVTSEKSHAESH